MRHAGTNHERERNSVPAGTDRSTLLWGKQASQSSAPRALPRILFLRGLTTAGMRKQRFSRCIHDTSSYMGASTCFCAAPQLVSEALEQG